MFQRVLSNKADLRALLSSAAQDGPALTVKPPPAPLRFDLDAGWPDPSTFPVELLRQLSSEALSDRSALEYTSSRYDAAVGGQVFYSADYPAREEMPLGYTGLRSQLAEWTSSRQGTRFLGPSNVMLTSGSTQGIALAMSAFVNPGEGALVDALTFSYAFRALRLIRADIRMVDMDEDGMMMDALERRLSEMRKDGVRPKLLYLIPSFHLPTSTVMPLERRRKVLELASDWNLVVLEDAIYSDLGYDGPPVPPSLLSLDTTGRVVQSHSFSKLVASGLRLGWITGEAEMIQAMFAVRIDLGVSQWIARTMSAYMARGELDPQIERVKAVYRRKRDIVAEALREHCGGLIDFTPPNGGIFFWIRVSDEVDWEKAKKDAALAGVGVREADRFMLMRRMEGTRHFRLGFGHLDEKELRLGIKLLGSAIKSAARK